MWENSCCQVQHDFCDLLGSIRVGDMLEVAPLYGADQKEDVKIFQGAVVCSKNRKWNKSCWPVSSLLEVLIVRNSVFWKTSRHPSLCIKFLVTELYDFLDLQPHYDFMR